MIETSRGSKNAYQSGVARRGNRKLANRSSVFWDLQISAVQHKPIEMDGAGMDLADLNRVNWTFVGNTHLEN
jgi:hypothetical protein